MINNERNYVLSRIRKTVAGSAAMFGYLFFVAVWITSGYQTANAQVVDCSLVNCNSTDQQIIRGYDMFDETNFDPVVDGLGRRRKFYVHIPASYDTLADNQLMPTIFAFHGGGQRRMDMIEGKWGDDYFNQEIAFVIPLGEPDPCDTMTQNSWIKPTWRLGAAPYPLPDNCNAATQRVDSLGNPVTYYSADLPETFTDVLFVENLRSIILSRFPKLNPNKVYATGFSSGAGLTNALLCYRSTLFRGFSVVAKTLFGEKQRGDYDADGIVETDPNSLIATCGKSQFDAGHATGITTPNLWGYGIAFTLPPPFPPLYLRNTKPVTIFVGDQDDNTAAEINDTTSEIRARNNLTSGYYLVNQFMNTQADEAETLRRIYSFASNPNQPSATFTRYLVRRVNDPAITPDLLSAGHGLPDEDEPPTANLERMTSDFNYTDRTVAFFESHADLNLNP